MFTDDMLLKAYYKMLQNKVDKQKKSIDEKARIYKNELETKAEVLKRQAYNEYLSKVNTIDRNTEIFKTQVDVQANGRKQNIEDEILKKKQKGLLTLEDVKALFEIISQKNY